MKGPILLGVLMAGIAQRTIGREKQQLTSLTKVVPAEQYFPAGALSPNNKMDRIKAEWYSAELAALREPSVWKSSSEQPKAEMYRFLWLRSFNEPICIRLTINDDGTGLLTTKEGSVHGVTDFGKLTRVETTAVSKEQMKIFLDRVRIVKFWNIRSPGKDPGGADGSDWIIEGARQGAYKVVDVWSAPAGDPVHALGAMLVFDLAHMRIPSELIY